MHYMRDWTGAARQITLQEYESLIEPDQWISEVSKGWLVREPRPNTYHSIVAGHICRQLSDFLQSNNVGRVIMEAGFRLSDVPLTIRGPDVAFIRHARVPTPLPRSGFWTLAPDLAIEILSPSNTAAQLQVKILEYFEAGTGQIWIIDPFNELATIYRSLHHIEIIRSPNTVIASELLPGFELRLASIFE